MVIGLVSSGQRQVAGCCEGGNEPSGSIKCGIFLDWLNTCWLLRKASVSWSYFVALQ